jgi:PPOX class probable F420-dependent enzyme
VTQDEIDTFLSRTYPALVGVVATTSRDGSPHAVPVWYSWDGEAVRVWTNEERQWVRNLRGDTRVAFSVQESQAPYGAVTMHGFAETRTDMAGLDNEIRTIVSRYLHEPDIEAYISNWANLRTIVRIRPTVIRAWSRGY